ncbi:MAG: hypothetical protein H6737_27670 [Alphaproteobacteria bacterium]|nr:hypothetical protein [Alphaproteobacteria bacterium]
MLVALFIIVDEDLEDPVYADPDPEDLEPELWERIGELVNDMADGEITPEGVESKDGTVLAWRYLPRNGLAFIAVVEDVPAPMVDRYLRQLQRQYFDEVDDVRRPEREGVADVVVDVIPPWEEDDD